MELTSTVMSVLIPSIIWDLIWKGFALWDSAKKKRLAWFVALLVLNTVGILPIIYLLFFRKKQRK